ncbi:MAG: RHS repeat-associated core domain-containing protein, partial [Cyanothece sp. SIO2G6]|nr:RHS repeat-associated core domain-containing protein [Cyanothece sp. SIO2G6]
QTTVMVYDAVNRLDTRTLPNGVTTKYKYQENTDWVESITHTDSSGAVLASVTYERNTDGTPHTITREEGTYVKLDYDDSLRLEQETYYSAGGIIVDEIAYTYDTDGNRQSVSSGVAEGTYAYDNTTHQLSGIISSSGDESYLYDSSGRIWQIFRDGETLTLSYNADEQLEKVTDSSGATVVEYTYDAEGRRLVVDDREYVVAPMVGTELDSPHLVTNADGDVVSSYVYAGAMPLMHLDANGDPVYYLTDAMGSVIGLADGDGVSAANIHYDSFGNVRSATGAQATVSSAAGGDFRFQGQWLESDTDLYHFRARYYDPEVGRFISRDPVDIIEMEPESSNPYQFVYNNPLIFSDPTGEFTITELNATDAVRNALQYGRSYLMDGAKDFIKDKVGEAVGNLLIGTLNSVLPGTSAGHGLEALANLNPDRAGQWFENYLTNQICGLLGNHSAFERVWLEADVSTAGVPHSNGMSCAEHNNPTALATRSRQNPNPDFLIKNGPPTDYSVRNSDAYLIGDIKLSLKTALNKVTGDKNQWQAMYRHARRFQALPMAMYVTFRNGNISDSALASQVQRAQREALNKNVVLLLVNIFN